MAKSPATTKAPKTPKFEIPAKPQVPAGSIEINDYTYTDAKGARRFWQGFDAKLKSALMAASRDPSTNGNTRKKAIRTLVERGWSTEEREAAYLQAEKEKVARAVAKAQAPAKKAAEKGKKTATKKADPTPEPEVEVTPEPELEDVEIDIEDELAVGAAEAAAS